MEHKPFNQVENTLATPKSTIRFKQSYTLQQKLDVINLYDEYKGDMKILVEKTQVTARLIKDWVKQRAEIEENRNKLVKRRLGGGGRKPLNLDLDRLVCIS